MRLIIGVICLLFGGLMSAGAYGNQVVGWGLTEDGAESKRRFNRFMFAICGPIGVVAGLVIIFQFFTR